VNGPLRGNRTWSLDAGVVREQICAGHYRYHTQLGCVALSGDTGRWVLHYSGTTLDDLPIDTLSTADEAVVGWVKKLS
jgi:hypothetical protein